jgi:hypothetical protein
MKILMTKIPNERKNKYFLTTTIYEKNGKRFAMKRATTQEAYLHLHSFQKKADFLKKNIINPKLKVNRIVKSSKNEVIFDYIHGISLEKLMYNALRGKKQDEFLSYVKEYADLLKNSFNFCQYREIETYLPDKFKQLFKNRDFLYFKPDVPFDLIPSNILKTPDGNYVIIDYEWTSSYPLPLEFIIFRGLYFSAEKYDSDAISHLLDMSLFSRKITIEDFQVLDKFLMDDIDPHKHAKLKTLGSKPEFVQRYSQLYIDTGNGFDEGNSMKQLLDLNKKKHLLSFKINPEETLKKLRFDPLNIPCVVQIDDISFLSEKGDVLSLTDFESNGITTNDKKYFFNHNDPQIHLDKVESEILIKCTEVKIKMEIIGYNENALELYSKMANELCSALYSNIDRLTKEVLNIKEKLTHAKTQNDIIKLQFSEREESLSSQIEHQKGILETQKSKIHKKHLENTSLQLKYETIIKKLNAEEKNRKTLLATVKKEEQNSAELKEKLKRITLELNKVNNKISEIKKSKKAEIAKLDAEINKLLQKINALEKETSILQQSLTGALSNITFLNEKLIDKDITILQYRKGIHEFRSSKSWRMTAPYRALNSFIAGFLKGDKKQ